MNSQFFYINIIFVITLCLKMTFAQTYCSSYESGGYWDCCSGGTSCATTPNGQACIPNCNTAADCPAAPGMTFACSAAGLCVPAR